MTDTLISTRRSPADSLLAGADTSPEDTSTDARPDTGAIGAADHPDETRLRAFVRTALRRPDIVLSVLVLAIVVAWAIAPSWFTGFSAIDGVPRDKLQAPSAQHWFGTDQLGRDLYARMVYGAAQSLAATAGAVAVGFVLGAGLGLLAGFLRGWVDDVIMRIVDILLSIPSLLLSLALITALGFGTINVAIAVGLASVASFARIMRAEVLRVTTAEYVEAARGCGVTSFGILTRHVLPNSAGPLLALTALEFGQAVLAISALSFLGFGAPPPAPEWGSLVAGGRDFLGTAWWLTTLPGLVIAVVVLAANHLSRNAERAGS